jgi:DNA-binding NtrC family response regulator
MGGKLEERDRQQNLGNSRPDNVFIGETLEIKINLLENLIRSFLDEAKVLREKRSKVQRIKLREEVRRFEINLIRSALDQTHGNQTAAAALLGTNVTTLNTKIRNYGISTRRLNEFKDQGASRPLIEIQDTPSMAASS